MNKGMADAVRTFDNLPRRIEEMASLVRCDHAAAIHRIFAADILADHGVALDDLLAEAVAVERERIAGEYRKLRGYPPSGPGSGDEVLAIIERRGRYWDGVLR